IRRCQADSVADDYAVDVSTLFNTKELTLFHRLNLNTFIIKHQMQRSGTNIKDADFIERCERCKDIPKLIMSE
ncbi:hypothetical protein PENTCL1PPCAC_8745, partial [Pristionchus entomophagus]